VKASAEAQLNPSIESASAQPREWVEVLLQLLGVGRVSSWRRAGVTTPALQTGKNPRIAANWPELPSKFIGLGDTAAESRASAPAPSVPIGKRMYARADITHFSDLYRRGQISEADYQRLSADIHAAVKEGRIVDPPMRGVGKTRF
jgi:hypothetical protein